MLHVLHQEYSGPCVFFPSSLLLHFFPHPDVYTKCIIFQQFFSESEVLKAEKYDCESAYYKFMLQQQQCVHLCSIHNSRFFFMHNTIMVIKFECRYENKFSIFFLRPKIFFHLADSY